jgi:ABC-type uncharacterized transport system auxiliary subunit
MLVLGLTLAVLTVVGCAEKGAVHHFDLHTKKPAAQSAYTNPVKIIIEPFEDRRSEKSRVGMRRDLWGGITYFNVAGERPGDLIAEALADRLRTRGWQEQAWNARVSRAGSTDDADIVISGQVRNFSADAVGRPFSTVIDTDSKFTIQARNLGDKSTTTHSVEAAESRTVFWFDTDDVQELLAATLNDGIDRLIADTMIEQKSLRAKR